MYSVEEISISLPAAPGRTEKFSLSAKPGRRFNPQPDTSKQKYPRQSNAYFNVAIEDPDDCLERVSFLLNDIKLPVPKGDQGWEISEWFTEEKPFLACLAPFVCDQLEVGFKEGAAPGNKISVRWKNIYVDLDKLSGISNWFRRRVGVEHPNFIIFYCVGVTGLVEKPIGDLAREQFAPSIINSLGELLGT